MKIEYLWNRCAQSFLKRQKFIHSMFDVGCSTFISFFFDQTDRSAASGLADT
ncbi:hypothetical protein D1BOALGB6SA_632 [Olavius sp. associated proteobacterium Delta 1]|nr:hypothetical protein D1BOALGB6SA_632 [Olavius sp. associated proteobacterium Delta 1]